MLSAGDSSRRSRRIPSIASRPAAPANSAVTISAAAHGGSQIASTAISARTSTPKVQKPSAAAPPSSASPRASSPPEWRKSSPSALASARNTSNRACPRERNSSIQPWTPTGCRTLALPIAVAPSIGGVGRAAVTHPAVQPSGGAASRRRGALSGRPPARRSRKTPGHRRRRACRSPLSGRRCASASSACRGSACRPASTPRRPAR